MNFLSVYFPLLVQGLYTTISSWIVAATLSIIIGTTLGIASSQQITNPTMQWIIKLYTFVAKGIPAYVQILIFYFVIPSIIPLSLSGFTAASCALAFCSSGYVTEIVRSSINAINYGQWEACSVLGYGKTNTIARIILPQAIRISFPALIGELEQLVKSTSLLATIGVTELTRSGMDIVSRELTPLPIYCSIALGYLLFSLFLNMGMIFFEKRMAYDNY